MKYDLLRADAYRRMPWKNGLGVTSEVHREAAAGEDESFAWRVSVADVQKNSLFSMFPGLTRVIATLEGAGMRLKVDGGWSEPLLKYEPFIFSGDSVTGSELLGGPIRDFNFIYDPRRCAARLEWLELGRPRTICSQAETMLIFAAGPTEVAGDDFSLSLNPYDSALLRNEAAELTRIRLSSPGSARERHCCLIEITSEPDLSEAKSAWEQWGPGGAFS